MKAFIKNTPLFLILFLLLLSKDFLYGVFIPKKEINIENAYIKSLETEIDNLKKIDNMSFKTNYHYGKVLYQNPYKFKKELVIAVNTDYLNKNDYVITNDGLIGVIDKIYKNMAIVKLLTNNNLILQVKINDCYGLLKYESKLIVSNISNYCEVKFGDLVYTSNLGYFDEEILIGKVKQIIDDKNDISNTYIINEMANFNSLDYVIVLSKGQV